MGVLLEYIEGQTLMLRDNASIAIKMKWVQKVRESLPGIRRAGFVQRNVKPDTVVIDTCMEERSCY